MHVPPHEERVVISSSGQMISLGEEDFPQVNIHVN
jgi:hypothetical protein